MILISTFRLAMQIHTRSANAKWLNEIAHTNPLWMHPAHAKRLAVRTGDLVRVETEIGYFVVHAWVSEGSRPAVLACSQRVGRWETHGRGQRPMIATGKLDLNGAEWGLQRQKGVAAHESNDPGTLSIWWSDVGAPPNLTFPGHPAPISG